MKRLRAEKGARSRLKLMERITIAPRQTVALIEADGQRLLAACAPEGAPAIYPLRSGVDTRAQQCARRSVQRKSRISW
jgi:hypothetical protein